MKVKVVGDAFVLESSVKVSDFELLKKHKPSALRITDEEGNDVFAVDYSAGKGSISKFGITFNGVSRDEKPTLIYTGILPANTANAKEFVADVIAPAYANLKEIEANIAEDAKEVADERKKLVDSIEG